MGDAFSYEGWKKSYEDYSDLQISKIHQDKIDSLQSIQAELEARETRLGSRLRLLLPFEGTDSEILEARRRALEDEVERFWRLTCERVKHVRVVDLVLDGERLDEPITHHSWGLVPKQEYREPDGSAEVLLFNYLVIITPVTEEGDVDFDISSMDVDAEVEEIKIVDMETREELDRIEPETKYNIRDLERYPVPL